MRDYVAMFILKTILRNKVEIQQVSIVFIHNGSFKYMTRFIKNGVKQSWDAIDVADAFNDLKKVFKDKIIILKNDDNVDLQILQHIFEKKMNEKFDNKIIDISKEAKLKGHKSTKLSSLLKEYDINIKNNRGLPVSVYKSQLLFLLASKMLGIR
ncbi:hypothetical protein [Malacoplasma iowae]|uniref:EXOIII domain protein n=2 Tax=Malacoplasma iowae TaxID=2116 RepID=A0A084U320_MALIO|nr:hypothetical protein [Malacoplasma iowae]VEU62036.1 Uncharacterised protein [Mycoplasmopsis fermentans]EGZ31593.1 hypothetical protein GUU_01207 [Malacoplasma iowae 695]KFB07356.1 EXOIII domain protein [Malacoplasma iowae DK-CPA]QHG90000.1 hypothetical protein EER00_03840 [Malacoplasma iowae 695]WPL36275.1 hypothetical protein QX180_02555 [Malacoplasma iowae]